MEELIKHLPKLARIEAQNIVKFVPKKIRKRLNFETFNPRYSSKCIYGQMFGNCNYIEARDVMRKCAPVKDIGMSAVAIDFSFTKHMKGGLCTPIEAAIVTSKYRSGNENLIKYLKQ